MNKLSELGHCFAYKDELLKAGTELLEVDETMIAKSLEIMIENKDLICENSFDTTAEVNTSDTSAIYLPVFYYSEIGTANRLLRLLSANKGRNANMVGGITGILNEWATVDSNAIHYDETQLRAIRQQSRTKSLSLPEDQAQERQPQR